MEFIGTRYPLFEYPTVKLNGNRGKWFRVDYLDCVCAFDIETSNILINGEPENIMYHWQFQLGLDCTILGRAWEEFLNLIKELNAECEEGCYRLVVYVHNLSYEFQYLRALLDFDSENVFIVKSRKILRALWKNIEFRCSYLHSNMSLALYTKKMMVDHPKLSGEEYEYDKVRYPWTELTAEEKRYCINDVLGLVEAVRKEMEIDGDTLATIPLTSTGYVRRDTRRAIGQSLRKDIERLLPDEEIYRLCREAFIGGNTHANRYYVGQILENVRSADRSSSYPDCQVNCPFPTTPFERRGPVEVDRVEKWIVVRGNAILMRVAFSNMRLRDRSWGAPYLSLSKCRGVSKRAELDNGRILYAEYLATTITDIDYKILQAEYTWDEIKILDTAVSHYGPLPEEIRKVAIEYYQRKTQLKDVPGQEILYTKSKNKLNSIYGMSAQDPAKQAIKLEGMEYVESEESIATLLEGSHKRQIMPYAWGVWTTAWARWRLEEGIRHAGEGFVYCDTDSVKSLVDIDFAEYNKKRESDSRRNGGFAVDPSGVTHYMGVYEQEQTYDRFITWGAKKYAYEINGKLGITIAGVDKKKGAQELGQAGGLEALKPGYTFKVGGGLELTYNDHPLKEVEIEGRRVLVPSNVVIRPSTYRLGLAAEYEELLEKIDRIY